MTKELVPLPPVEATRGYSVVHCTLYLDCSVPTIYNLIKSGRLGSRKLGKKRIVPGAEIIRFLSGHAPLMQGDPIDPRASELGRVGGKVGGKARWADDREAPEAA